MFGVRSRFLWANTMKKDKMAWFAKMPIQDL